MATEQHSLLLESSSLFPLPHGMTFSYGTAGFRSVGSKLSSTVFRAGIVAALRSLNTGSAVGLMITASHNPIADNGVKIADPDGSMMAQHWEPFAQALANAPNPQSLVELVFHFSKEEGIPLGEERSAEILLGRDTRPTGEALLEAAKQGIKAIIGAVALDMGIVTTPQLHWMVMNKNKGLKASEFDYFAQLSESFRCLMEMVPKGTRKGSMDSLVIVDGANGVGGEKLEQLKIFLIGMNVCVRNTGKEEGVLNDGVGADFVQKEKVAPTAFATNDVGQRCASFDGDADRVVYFRISSANGDGIDLVDGDKILSLFALFIEQQLHILNKKEDEDMDDVSVTTRVGIVQTAYANGASTDYLKQLGLEVIITPTGVKYLHKKAAEYDIGIYFEANGHGTILFSEDYLSKLQNKCSDLASCSPGSETHKAALRLLAVSKLINQAVGDAISGLLLVEVILQHMGWTMQNWIDLYNDLPSRQLKVKVADRTAVTTTHAETQVLEPSGLQDAIDFEIAKYHRGRCFVRPSGTEDIIRVYAEASSQEDADDLAKAVSQHVEHFLG